MINLNETINRIKAAGVTGVRAVPMDGQSVHDGLYRIEIKENSTWTVIVENVPRQTANNLIEQSTNRVLCG